jgi:GNAT superfamily N-acetyltransferase
MSRDVATLPTIEIMVTELEMRAPPAGPPKPMPMGKYAVLHAENPPLAFYRYLYNTIGDPWQWTHRRLMPDDELLSHVADPKVEIYVLYAAGVPAGYVELDYRYMPDADIAYFGLMPEFIGRGLGAYLLDWAVRRAWQRGPGRITVNTCNLDHPRALAGYQRVGFVAFDRHPHRLVPMAVVHALERGQPIPVIA